LDVNPKNQHFNMIDQIGHGVRHKKRQYIDSFPAVGELDEYGYRHLYPQKG
jgi:hypothetical protein